MKRVMYLTLLLSVIFTGVKAQDSLFFYKSGNIIYKESGSLVDSVTFLAPDYYGNCRSNNVLNTLKSTPDLTKFAQMIQIAGYENKLDDATIWAPVNSALSQIDLSDVDLVIRIVRNQISKSKLSITLLEDSLKVTMLNNKHYVLKKAQDNYSLDGNQVLTPNVYTAASVIHVLQSYVSIKPNLWEYITQGTGHDLMKTFVNGYNITTFDSIAGTYTTTNDLLDQVLFADNEDSLCTAIIPTDDAWNDAYTKLYPYCAAPTGGTIDNHDYATRFAIIRNNFFRGKLNSITADSVYTASSGYQLKSPATMLEGAQNQEVSNGNCITVNQLKMYNPEYWNKEIRIEAENAIYGTKVTNFNADITSCTNGNFNISNNKYLILNNTSTNNLIYANVEFPIPNTLSTKYNVYCVFVPGAAVDTSDHKPYKVRFYLSYLDNKNSSGTSIPTGFQVTKATVDANNAIQLPTIASHVFITDGATVQKMLVVKDLQLPFCNLYMSTKSTIKFSLFIESAAKTTETTIYNRNIRIDCIILEPVQ
jgi:hypothetical protein